MGQRSVPAPFLTKTFELVDDRSSDDVISWGEKEDTFVVWKTAEFAKDLLPTYFKHNNFSSFVRQLNTYGFRKTAQDKWEFANENFKRGQKGLLTEIRRRKSISLVKPSGKSAGGNPPQWEEAGSPSTSSPESSKNRSSSSTLDIADLSGENEKLRRENEMLNSELFQMKQQYDELTAFLKVKANRDESLSSDDDDVDEMEGGLERRKMMEDEGLRLFGVWFTLQGKKRGRCCDDSQGNNHNSMTIDANQACPKGKAMKI